jgi:DNA-binding SARP family transcriptional activator
LLGGFELRLEGRSVLLAPNGQRLLGFLALQHRPVRRTYVAGMLWLDSSQEAANASLRTALWRIPRPHSWLVDVGATHLALARGVAVDLHEVATVARRVTRDVGTISAEDLDTLSTAGELLPDWYDDWVLVERERFHQVRLHALEAVCIELTRQRRYGDAVEAGLAAVAAEPSRESAHRAVIRAHLAEQNPGEALRQYTVYRRLLESRLGLEPSEEMERLRRQCEAPTRTARSVERGTVTDG